MLYVGIFSIKFTNCLKLREKFEHCKKNQRQRKLEEENIKKKYIFKYLYINYKYISCYCHFKLKEETARIKENYNFSHISKNM